MDVDSLTGPAYVIDGDTIKLKNKRIRLHGIDAPERKQWCLKNSKKYRCGEKATGALKEKIGVAEKFFDFYGYNYNYYFLTVLH